MHLVKVVEYILYQLISGYKSDKLVQKVLDNYDFYALPVVNPDGKSAHPHLTSYLPTYLFTNASAGPGQDEPLP